MPFMIIDKVHARAMIFDAIGHLQGTALALLGLARGDDSAPSIGQRKLSSIRPDERHFSALSSQRRTRRKTQSAFEQSESG